MGGVMRGGGAMAAPVSMHYEINQEDVIMSRDALMCRWTMRTVRLSPTHPPTHPPTLLVG